MREHHYQRLYCTTLCPHLNDFYEDCSLCRVLDESDRLWFYLQLKPIWAILWSWTTDACGYIVGPTGYRVVVPAIVTFVGAYFGVYAVMEARYERRRNHAAFERSAFIDLVTSNNRGAFIAAMKSFGRVQTMAVPPEPVIWPPWNWWDKPSQPNMVPLYLWVKYFFPLCTPQSCGQPDETEPKNVDKGVRIDLRGVDLGGANLSGKYLDRAMLRAAKSVRGAHLGVPLVPFIIMRGLNEATYGEVSLHGADLLLANLRGAHLSGVSLRKVNLRMADLRGADLISAYLVGANLSEADLSMAHLIGAYLSEANLSWADLSGADLTRADLVGAHLDSIKWDKDTTWPDGFSPPPSRP